jgi:glycosyltransferase involved in cell wall biosynthesis
MHTLYLCYFGLREPLVQTQVLPYLRQLVAGGVKVSLLTFEPEMRSGWSEGDIVVARSRLLAEGIKWRLLPYHKRPSLPATLYDIAAGARYATRLAKREKIDVFHARSHVAAAMGALAKWRSGGWLVFDIRGFMPEEYVDAGMWKDNGLLYRGMKAIERELVKSSDAFIVLTEKAREILFPGCKGEDRRGRPIEVIPCCIDPLRFRGIDESSRAVARREMNLDHRRVIAYVGSFGGWYLTDEMMSFFATAKARDRSTFVMVLTQSDAGEIERRLCDAGLREGDFFVSMVAPADVPRYLQAADMALSFIKPCYSKRASSPTKVAEYLACGLPVVSNAGIGDLDDLFESERVGAIVREFTPKDYLGALDEINRLQSDQNLRGRCREVALARFDLNGVGGVRYRRLYARLSGSERPGFVSNQVPGEVEP